MPECAVCFDDDGDDDDDDDDARDVSSISRVDDFTFSAFM